MSQASGVAFARQTPPRGEEQRRDARPCAVCGKPMTPRAVPGGSEKKHCSQACRRVTWERANPERRQKLLPLEPEPQPVPPVRHQVVPPQERRPLSRMSRLILERLESGEALASELGAMFPGARSVRTRISDVNLWLQTHRRQKVESEPVRGVVGEWRYWIEATP